MKDFSNVNPNDFTQKDLMLHLLQVSQHAVTREELKEDISYLKEDILGVDNKISKVEDKISKVEDKISKVEVSLREDISKVDAKFDKIQWLIIATMFTVLFKDYLVSFFNSVPK